MRLALVSGPDAGHLLPVVALGCEAARRGHDVVVVSGAEWAGDVEAAGLGFAALPGVAAEPGDSDLGWRMWGRAASMAPALADLLAEHRVDLVAVDTLTAAGGFAAELRGVPWVEVIPHWLWAPSVALPPIGLGQAPARTPAGRLLEAVQRRQQARSFAEGDEQRARARALVGLRPSGGPTLRILATLPDLELPRPDWPSRTVLTGPLEWEPASWPALTPPEGDGPLVVVTDSTATGVEATLVDDVVVGLDDPAVRLAVTTRRPVRDRPATVSGRGRHGPLLDVADCAVGFAGHGFVAKALVRGVPLVLVALQGDQRETVGRLVRLGAALAVPIEEVTPARLASAVRTVLDDPAYRRTARRVGRGARGLGAGRAMDLLERAGGRGALVQRRGRDARG